MKHKLISRLFFSMMIAMLTIQSCDETEDSETIGNWVNTVPFMGAPRSGSICFTIDNKVYVGLGFNPNSDDSEFVTDGYFSDFYMFDANLGYWERKASFPGTLRERAVAFSINGKGYIGLGYNRELDDTELRDFWSYDPALDQWTRNGNDFLGSARYNAVGFSIGSSGYVGTGFDNAGNYNSDFYKYNPEQDSWTQIPSLPGVKRERAFAFVIDDKAYVGGGISNGSNNYEFFQFDPQTGSWSDLKVADDDDEYYDEYRAAIGRSEAVTFVLNGKAYIGTGMSTGGSIVRTMYEYDPSSDQWDDITNFEGAARNLAVAYVVGGRAYVGTGQYSTSRYDDIWEFRPDEEYDSND